MYQSKAKHFINEIVLKSSQQDPIHSSQLAEPLWTDPGVKGGISMHELISTSKKKKKAQAGNEWSNILPKSSQARKKPPPNVNKKINKHS